MILSPVKRAIRFTLNQAGLEIHRRRPAAAAIAPEHAPASEPAGAELYRRLYGADVFERRPFLNIGAGSFRHAAWRNLDFYTEAYAADVAGNMDMNLDLSECRDFPLGDAAFEAVFTSHTIEHIPDAPARKVFQEAYRILKPGGIFRVTCPDIELYYDAYRRGDRDFFMIYGHYYRDHPIEQLFLREFATQLSEANNDDLKAERVFSAAEIRDTFNGRPMEAALEHFSAMIDYHRFYKVCPGNHVNWWGFNKLASSLRQAGFSRVWRSGYGQSTCPVMRDIGAGFDATAPQISIYVEARK